MLRRFVFRAILLATFPFMLVVVLWFFYGEEGTPEGELLADWWQTFKRGFL